MKLNKDSLILQSFQKIDELSLQNKRYRLLVDALFVWLMKTDRVARDITTQKLGLEIHKTSSAVIIGRENLTIAGLEEVMHFLEEKTSLAYSAMHSDGESIKKGQVILKVSGKTYEILMYERVILNFLQRLSGIATTAHSMVTQIKKLPYKSYIAATRKTNWGLLDKKAVALGGGLTHRLSLADGVLLKDNHLVLLRRLFGLQSEEETIIKALDILLKNCSYMTIEIEVEMDKSMYALIDLFNKEETDNRLCILLDNFSPDTASKAISVAKDRYDCSSILFEASGGITSTNIRDWAKTGVDIISLGSLTHSSKAADISLDFI